MIALLRILAVAIFSIVMFIGGCSYCLLSPRNPKNLFAIGRLFSKMSRVFGVKLELRIPEDAYKRGQFVYIANHQNNWDMFTISGAVTPNVVTVGKKVIAWMPLLGQLYWLSGNILIDRGNRSKAKGTIDQVVAKMKKSNVSIWMFPEGTRSRGRGLLPFKTGAFHTALGAQVDILPIVCSSTNHIKLNRWNNGHVIIEMLPPIPVSDYSKETIRDFSKECHRQMAIKLAELDQEVAQRN